MPEFCEEMDGRAALDGFWCGYHHMQAVAEMKAYAEERAEAGLAPCDFIERQMSPETAGRLAPLGHLLRRSS